MKNIIFCLTFLLIYSFKLPARDITLSQFLKLVEEQNLTLKLEKSKLKNAESQSDGIRLPPPMVSFIKMKTQNGETANGFEIDQQIPFPTKINSEHAEKKINVEIQIQNINALTNETLAKAKFAFIELWVIQEKTEILLQKKKIIESHLKLTQSVVRSDSFLKIHLLKAESDLDLLENEIDQMKQALKEKQLTLTEIANQNYFDFAPVAIPPSLSTIPTSIDVSYSPQLKALKLTYDGMKEKEKIAQASWLPEFGIKYKKLGETSMSSSYSETMVGITLPFLFFWQPKSEVRSAQTDSLQAELMLNRENKLIETKVISLNSKLESLKYQMQKIQNQLLPRAEKRKKIVHNLAPRDVETLQDHRDTMEAFPELKMTELNLRLEYERAISELEQYIRNKGATHE
jgi:outer membrane protein TolC